MKINEPFWAAFHKHSGNLAGGYNGFYMGHSKEFITNRVINDSKHPEDFNIVKVKMVTIEEAGK